MSIEHPDELEGLRRAGAVVAGTLRDLRRRVTVPVANVFDASARARLTAGLVITVEPIIAAGHGDVVNMPDGWTVRTADGSPVAHAEHTIVVTDGRPLVLTA
jgi:methionine aminopeptidase